MGVREEAREITTGTTCPSAQPWLPVWKEPVMGLGSWPGGWASVSEGAHSGLLSLPCSPRLGLPCIQMQPARVRVPAEKGRLLAYSQPCLPFASHCTSPRLTSQSSSLGLKAPRPWPSHTPLCLHWLLHLGCSPYPRPSPAACLGGFSGAPSILCAITCPAPPPAGLQEGRAFPRM